MSIADLALNMDLDLAAHLKKMRGLAERIEEGEAAALDLGAMKEGQALLPPWSPEQRERSRRELQQSPMVMLELGAGPPGSVGIVRKVMPRPTVLREERRARAANIAHYCRKCRGLGAKRHHAMCSRRGAGQRVKNPTYWIWYIQRKASVGLGDLHSSYMTSEGKARQAWKTGRRNARRGIKRAITTTVKWRPNTPNDKQ